MQPLFGFFPSLGPWEILVLLGLGILLFGRKLPEVGRSLGKSLVEFKKGMKGLEDEVEGNPVRGEPMASEAPRPPQRVATTAPKFEDVPSVPVPPKV